MQLVNSVTEAEESQYSLCRQLSIGGICMAVCNTAALITNFVLTKFLSKRGWDFSTPQNAISYFQSVFTKGNKWMKLEAVCHISILGPVMEEFAFRGYFHNLLRSWFKDPDSPVNKVIRLVTNAFFFATAHLSVVQGATNLPIFVATFFMGLGFSAAREFTGSVFAPTFIHVFNNLMACFELYLSLPGRVSELLLPKLLPI